MKKEGIAILLVILSILLISLSVFAQEDEIDKAYDCLEDKVKDKCPTSVEGQAFTVLATGKCSSELREKGKDNECWPSGGCRLRDTALAVLALDRVGRSTSDAEDWLLDHKKIPKDLIWYLEIDTDEETECEITYGSTERTIKIREDKKINRKAGTCLPLATKYDNYWLKIKDTDACYNHNFTISCDKDFKTTLLYEKDSTIYVSSKTNSASAEGETEERVNAFCFEQAGCSYEGSLWATLALAKTGHDISEFLPYLIAMAEDNEKFLPSAFLYILTNYDEYFTQIIDEQKSADYWEEGTDKYYDTALALLALYGLDAEQAEAAKDYLLDNQDSNGCWDNDVRDTAFILYAAWPESVSGDGGEMDDCEDYGHYCSSRLDCYQDDVLENYVCYGGKVCCRTGSEEKTCHEKGGIECQDNQQCTGATVPASDTAKCCKGSCITEEEEPECEGEGFTCRYSCLDDEEERVYDCETGKTCCAPKRKAEKSYWWIWLLIILIILLVIGIIFRNQLRIWLFRIKSKFRKQPPRRPGPRGFPPAAGRVMPRARPRMMLPRQPARRPGPIRKAISKTDKELEETLKKLKEMSK